MFSIFATNWVMILAAFWALSIEGASLKQESVCVIEVNVQPYDGKVISDNPHRLLLPLGNVRLFARVEHIKLFGNGVNYTWIIDHNRYSRENDPIIEVNFDDQKTVDIMVEVESWDEECGTCTGLRSYVAQVSTNMDDSPQFRTTTASPELNQQLSLFKKRSDVEWIYCVPQPRPLDPPDQWI